MHVGGYVRGICEGICEGTMQCPPTDGGQRSRMGDGVVQTRQR
jgi:hypothetical protein